MRGRVCESRGRFAQAHLRATLNAHSRRCIMASILDTLRERLLTDNPVPATAEEALAVANLPGSAQLDIIATAQLVRSRHMGSDVTTCGIINAKSGRCSENCCFCAQSGHHTTDVRVYPLVSVEEMVDRARVLAQAGVARYGIVTSGKALSDADLETICEAARRIRKELPIAVDASLGMLTPERAQKLKAAGVSRYHHNLETSKSFFPHICSTHEYEDDINTVRCALAAGLEVCSGGIFGLGESWEQRIEMSSLLRDLDVTAIPCNFLTPIPGTPLGESDRLSPFEALRILAVYRFMHPARQIYVCGGREKTLGAWRSWIFMAGASGVMTGNYLTTKGNDMDEDDAMLREMGARQ